MKRVRSLPEIDISIAQESDWPGIIEIYNQSIKTGYSTADLTSVTVQSRREWFLLHTREKYPIYVARKDFTLVGWCSISPHRPGRMALKNTAEISYYIDERYQRQGIATSLINHSIEQSASLGLKNLFALLLDINKPSIKLLERCGFKKWGHLPKVAEIDGRECGQFIYGINIIS